LVSNKTSNFYSCLSTPISGYLAIFLLAFNAVTVLAAGPEFSAEQAAKGQALYREHCQICHGTSLANGQFGTPLRGSYFRNRWAGKSVGELLQFTMESMPPDRKGELPHEEYAAMLAFILFRNDIAESEQAMAADSTALQDVILPWPLP
jgi:mono/diheme cytochrome c family protein